VTQKVKGKRGRPPLPEDERKGAVVKFRVEEDVRQKLMRNADKAGMNLSDYLRERGLA
jgi:hypothetical protein